jgi:hypothetical protein
MLMLRPEDGQQREHLQAHRLLDQRRLAQLGLTQRPVDDSGGGQVGGVAGECGEEAGVELSQHSA